MACAEKHQPDLAVAGCSSTAVEGYCGGAAPPPATLNGHPLKLDADGLIQTWLPNATVRLVGVGI